MNPPSYMPITWMLCVAIIAVVGISNACATANLASLEGTWRLVSVDSRPLRQLPTDQVPHFTIRGMTVNGFDGCNSFDGRIDQPGNISSTRRGCQEDTIKLPLDLGDLQSQLITGTIKKNFLSMPAYGRFPAAMFERSENRVNK
jgi:heat shock protein HslJ